jgi:PKHD-type hydroxylase
MIVQLRSVLTPDDADLLVSQLVTRPATDGALTAGIAHAIKHNREVLDPDLRQQLSTRISQALQGHAHFLAAALPKSIYPFLFNCHREGMFYGPHLDEPLMGKPPSQLRADLALTLFLSEPASYDGGELSIDADSSATHVKLPRGDAVLYPASAVHEVMPVTRGVRWAAVSWVQSLVRRTDQRDVMWQLALAAEDLRSLQAADASRERKDGLERRLLGLRANLLRMWGES